MIARRKIPRAKANWTQAFPEQVQPAAPKVSRAKPRRRLPPMSPKRIVESKEYLRAKAAHLKKNPWCAWGLAQNPPEQIKATTIHHTRGRDGDLYLNPLFFMGMSLKGHMWTEANKEAARNMWVFYNGRRMSLVCQRGEWGKQDL